MITTDHVYRQVMEQYAKDGFAFLLQVFNNPDHLEQVSGLADLHKDMACIEVLNCSL